MAVPRDLRTVARLGPVLLVGGGRSSGAHYGVSVYCSCCHVNEDHSVDVELSECFAADVFVAQSVGTGLPKLGGCLCRWPWYGYDRPSSFI